MHDGRLQRVQVAHALGDVQRQLELERPALELLRLRVQQLVQVLVWRVLLHQPERVAQHAKGKQVGVVEQRVDRDLLLEVQEPPHLLLVVSGAVLVAAQQLLHRHLAAVPLGLPDLSEAAPAQRLGADGDTLQRLQVGKRQVRRTGRDLDRERLAARAAGQNRRVRPQSADDAGEGEAGGRIDAGSEAVSAHHDALALRKASRSPAACSRWRPART